MHLDRWTTDLDFGRRSHLSVLADIASIDPCTLRQVPPDAHDAPIFAMGSVTETAAEWHRRRHESAHMLSSDLPSWCGRHSAYTSAASPTATPAISVLCSLYRSDAHLDRFLGNILEQTAFIDAEFLIVVTDPSAYELHELRQAAAEFSNIRVDVVADRIGIYEAWNRAARTARGRYLTTMNADDLRRSDSLERQREVLDASPWLDVVYQDVLVSLDPESPWGVLEAIGARSTLPPVSLPVLLSYVNPPHNAPMWRRSLHDTVGWFDESFTSAGDADFWIRAARAGATFMKSRDVHVGYYVNPTGLSTRPETRGVSEHRSIHARHAELLLAGPVRANVRPPIAGDPPLSRADRTTRALIEDLRSVAASMSARSGAPSTRPHSTPVKVVLDDHVIALGCERARDAWTSFLTEWTPTRLAERGIELTIVNRSDALTHLGHNTIPFAERPWNSPYPAADRQLLTHLCASLRTDVFICTSHTFPVGTRVVAIDLSNGTWHPSTPPSIREGLEGELTALVTAHSAPIDLTHPESVRSVGEHGEDFTARLRELHDTQLRMQR